MRGQKPCPTACALDGTRLYVTKVGWVRLAGNHGCYLGGPARQVRLLKEGDERHPKGLVAQRL